MKINIVKGSIDYVEACEEALLDSELGRKYFSQEGSARKAVEEGISKEELYVAVDENKNCVGFLWFMFNGIFHSFPYLHIIAVKSECRGYGIGKEMMQFFESICFKDYNKVFLVVADFNPEGKKFYEKDGYEQVGIIPSLYRDGITEFLMMKTKSSQKRTFSIRRARKEEAEAITNIAVESEAYWGFDEDYMKKFKSLYNVTEQFVVDNPTFVLEANNIGGFYSISLGGSKSSLEYFYIAPQYIGKGYGKLLWLHVEESCKKYNIDELEFVTSPEAKKFYLKMGCIQIGETESFLKKGRRIPKLIYKIKGQ
jgi:ribosomal protein S18 acetylase RimI-like enzyme